MGGRIRHTSLLFVILIISFFSLVALETCRDKTPLAHSLDEYPQWQRTKEIHLHGDFRLNLTQPHSLNFTIQDESFFRAYMSPHAVDIDLYLFKGDVQLDLSISSFKEENIAQKLQTGSYRLEIRPLAFHLPGSIVSENVEQSVIMEIAIAPVEVVNSRVRRYTDCPSGELFPEPSLSSIAFGDFSYSSEQDPSNSKKFNIHTEASEQSWTKKFVKGYSFTVSPEPGTNPLFEVRANVGYEFLTGGSIRLVLAPTSTTGELPQCDFWLSSKCINGNNTISNKNSIVTAIGPGNYTLWIVDLTGKKFANLTTCTPFSLDLAVNQLHTEEDFVSCHAEAIPTNLHNDPGFIDDSGYLHFREEVFLNLTSRTYSTEFILRAPSRFRIMAEASRVDIDLELRNSTNTIARTIQGANKSESIMMDLEAGVTYTIYYHYYTALEAAQCETFLLEIEIDPVTTQDVDYCTGHQTSLPLIPSSPISGVLFIDKTEFNYVFPDRTNNAEILRAPLSVTSQRWLTVDIGVDFLTGLSLTLEGSNQTFFVADSVPSGLHLSTVLVEGQNYTLVISAGASQSVKTPLQYFPTCAFFDFKLSISGPPMAGACNRSPRLPTSLNGPSYLGSSNRVHLREEYLVERPLGGFDSEEKVTFSVRQRSLFRAYTELDGVQSGFFIAFSMTSNDGSAVPHVSTEVLGEKMSVILTPNVDYTFHVSYTADFSKLPRCQTWNLELEIAPIDTLAPGDCQRKLPPQTMWLGDSRTTISEQYAFPQEATTFNHSIAFTLNKIMYFRAQIFYDFLWSDLSLRLLSENGTITVLGRNQYNKNEIEGVQLNVGNHVLEIFEPQPQEVEEHRRCAEFTLTIGVAPFTPDMRAAATPCKELMFPTNLNTISYLSPMSGNQMYFADKVLMDVEGRKASTKFEITEPSYFRLQVPPFIVDIDLYLYRVEDEIPRELAKSIGYEEESIFYRLESGNYLLRFSYLPHFKKGFFYPNASECAAFRVELAITPVALAEATLSPPPCTPAQAPAKLDGLEGSITLQRTLTPAQYSIELPLRDESFASITVSYPYPLGGLYVTLVGTNILSPFKSAPANRTYVANIAQGIASLDEILYPGEYYLHINDVVNYTIKQDQCSAFTLSWQISTTIPPNCCDDADRIPTDLTTEKGGSKPYGGPQNPDGSTRISGKRFLLPEKNTHSNLLFSIKETSWVRYWAKTSGAKNDVDFFLWKNSSKTEFIDASLETESVESRIIVLEPQEEPYLLDLYVFDRSGEQCTYVEFEFAIELNSSVVADRRCPNPIPNPALPPSSIELTPSTIDIFSTELMFTSDFIANHSVDRFAYYDMTYDMTIIVPSGNFSIYTWVGYDFTLTDFKLSLWKDNVKIQNSVQSSTYWINSFVDFQDTITADLSVGTYVLRLQERIYKQRPVNGRNDCDRFSFMLLTEAKNVSAPLAASITSVNPPSGTTLDANAPLSIDITFGVGVSNTVPSSYIELRDWVTNNHAIYLQNAANATETSYPTSLYFNFDRTRLTVIFVNLHFSKTYNLIINTDNFTSINNTAFEKYTKRHSYTMLDCTCSGHGHCAPNAFYVRDCICDYPYAGSECKSCVEGYHREATTCVVNTYCQPNTCNGNGRCDDSQGYPQCDCFEGFDSTATGFCDKCHVGYVGYPNCTALNLAPSRCSDPFLPLDLNSVAFLEHTGSVHLQNNYFIDLQHTSHEMKFSLKEDSFFRIYVEPHKIDIDIWLWSVKTEDGSKWNNRELVASGISYNQEESLFLVLKPGDYLLVFNYIPLWRYETDPCPTFNMELAIEPKPAFQAEIARYSRDCATQKLPSVQLPADNKITSDFLYNSTDIFALIATGGNNTGNVYVLPFRIEGKPGQAASVHAELTYRFLSSDMALQIVKMDNNTNTSIAVGYNDYNKHYLQFKLLNGDYALSIYLPKPQSPDVNPCNPFNFMFKVTFENADEDLFNCNYPRLPTSFVTAPYKGDHVHLFGDFLIETETTSIVFNVTELSSIRAYVQANVDSRITISLARYREATKDWDILDYGTNGQVSLDHLRPDNQYRLSFTTPVAFGDADTFCPTMQVEVEIETNAMLAVEQNTIQCPVGGFSRLPTIPSTFLTLPYNFHAANASEELFYAFSTTGQVVMSSTFTLRDSAFVDIGIAAHFLTGNLMLRLKKSDTTSNQKTLLSKGTQENYNYIQEPLEAGTYTLEILNYASFSTDLVQCIPFTFDMSVISTTAYSTQCPGLSPLPTSLNTMRYMNIDDEVIIQKDNWAIPDFTTFYSAHTISFDVEKESVIRVYVEKDDVDIDIHLYANDSTTQLDSGSNQFGEESLVTAIQPGHYRLRLDFFNLRFINVHCESFNMEIAIAPLDHLKTTPLCPDVKKSFLPEVPETVNVALNPYNFQQGTNEFYYQQTDHKKFAYTVASWVVTFKQTVDLHIEVGYNFITGDLSLLLQDTQNKQSIYGKNEYARNVLNQKKLPAGTYNLTLYEPVGNTEKLVGCSQFVFNMIVDKAKDDSVKVTDYTPLVPTDLNSVGFLRYSDNVHIQNNYIILEQTAINKVQTIHFHLAVESFVRTTVATGAPLELEVSGTSENSTGHRVNPSLFSKLAPGDHELKFYLKDERITWSVISETELLIIPVDDLRTRTSNMSCAGASKWIPPAINIRPTDGFYTFHDKHAYLVPDQLRTTNELYRIPFTLANESEVAIQLHYDFAVTDLTMYLHNTNSFLSLIFYFSTNHYNVEDLNVHLFPGRYELVLKQTNPWNSALTGLEIPCVEFDLSISISKGQIPPCDYNATFPWDLNLENGGSKDYGGPIRNGRLNLWNSAFLLNSDSNKLSTKLTLEVPSVISIFTSEKSWSSLTHTISTNNTQVARPVASNKNFFQNAAIYQLQPNDYLLQFQYRPSRFEACNVFTFGMSVIPQTDLLRQLESACSGTKNALPDTIVPKQTYNIQSYFSEDDIRQHSDSLGYFSRAINFTVAGEYTYLDVSISYSSLASMFTLKMKKRDAATWAPSIDGDWSALSSEGSSLQFSQKIQTNIMQAGEYMILIEQIPMNYTLPSTLPKCYPFQFTAYYSGVTSGGPVVTYIDPPSGTGFDPKKLLFVEMRFSSSPYDKQGNPITRSSNTKALIDSIYLKTDNGTRITPDDVDQRIAPDQDDYRIWEFIFNKNGQFQYGVTYELGIDEIHNAEGGRFELVSSTRRYTMKDIPKDCSGRGTFNEDTMKCECNADSHAHGDQCQECDSGYAPNRNGQCTVSGCAIPEPCGCLPKESDKDNCVPRGTCNVDVGAPQNYTCACRKEYSGKHCEQCAAGLKNFPYCDQKDGGCNPPCQHGTCQESTGVCLCPENFQGPTCAVCAPGYSGADCEGAGISGTWKLIGGAAAVIAALGIVGVLVWWFKYRKGPNYEEVEKMELEMEGGRRMAGGGDDLVGLEGEDTSEEDQMEYDADDKKKENDTFLVDSDESLL